MVLCINARVTWRMIGKGWLRGHAAWMGHENLPPIRASGDAERIRCDDQSRVAFLWRCPDRA